MAHNISIVPAVSAGATGGEPATAEEIKELEELWGYFVANASTWAHWKGDDKAAREAYKARANAYLRNRTGGALNLRQIRRQNLPDNEMKFTIEPYKGGSGE